MLKKLFFISLLALVYGTGFSQLVYNNYIDGAVYVKFRASALKKIRLENPNNLPVSKVEGLSALMADYGITKVYKPFYQAGDDEVLFNTLKIEFSKASKVEALIAGLRQLPGVEYAEKVTLNKTHATPNDPLYSGQLHLAQINAPNAWNVFNGTSNGNSNITVAIIDNAVMWQHVDLVANTYTNTGETPNNGIDDDNNGYVDDVNGYDVTDHDNNANPTQTAMQHGTHCAGIAGARTDNATGVASIGWNVKIIPVKCQTDNGNPGIVANGFEGIVYATKAKARVISCSWGNSGSATTEQAVVNYAWNRGCIVVASAGNNGNNTPNYPGAYNNVYCVASVDAGNIASGFTCFGTWVDICAPGNNINSTLPYTPSTTPSYGQLSGTSMATPMVAGLAALMLSKSPNMTRANVLNCISSTAVNIYTLSGNSSYASGNQLGAGRIDAFAAMNCAATFSATAPLANFYGFPLYTCPGTNVNMYDSSLYAPTSWNWTFQGGTPSTSTLANPVVHWNSPGTYSVSLTVSNASGTNTATKVSYVNVAAPLALPFSEGFQNASFLPVNWSPNNIFNDAIFWERKTGLGGYGTSTACAMFDNFTYFVANDRDEMRSPKYNLSAQLYAMLRFDVAYAKYDAVFSDSLEVRLSTDCGSNWTTIYLKGGSSFTTAPDNSSLFVPNASQWRTDSVNVTALAAGQGNVMFSFVNRGHYGQPIYLDNINLFTSALGINIASTPTTCISAPVNFSNTASGSSSYQWTFTGGSPSSSTLSAPTVTYASPGTYSVALVRFTGNTTVTAISSITVLSGPSLSSPVSFSVCIGNAGTIVVSGASTYSLNNVAGNGNFTVNPVATSIYTVSGSNGNCISTAPVTVYVAPQPSLSVSSTSSGCNSSCLGTMNATVSGGTSGFNYTVSGTGCNALPCTNLCNGIYTLMASDISNCQASSTFTINSTLNTLASTVQVLPASCLSCADGNLTLTVSGGTPPYTYTWVPAGGSSSVATGLAAGCYTANVADINNCDLSIAACLDVTGTPENTANAGFVRLFPNPASGRVTIQNSNAGFEAKVFDACGRMVLSRRSQQTSMDIDTGELSNGMYMVIIKDEKYTTGLRFVKEETR